MLLSLNDGIPEYWNKIEHAGNQNSIIPLFHFSLPPVDERSELTYV